MVLPNNKSKASKQSIVLTGATGFIGNHLLTSLVSQGYHVYCVVRNPKWRPPKKICTNVDILFGDLESDILGVREKVRECVAIVYCAGSVRGLVLEDFLAGNVRGVSNFAKIAEEEMQKPRLLLISSLAAKKPELSFYAKSKSIGEKTLRDSTKLDWVVIRPTAVYGKGDRELLPIFSIIRQGLKLSTGPKYQMLTFIHVSDLVKAVVCALENFDKCSKKVFELCDGNKVGYNWDEITQIVGSRDAFISLRISRVALKAFAGLNEAFARLIGYKPMLTNGKVREIWEEEWCCKENDFRQITEWRPKISLKKGIEREL